MRDNNELRVNRHLDDLVSKASHVRFVKWSVYFVQQTKRRRAIMEDSQHECKRRHRLFTTRQEQHVLQTLTRRLSDYIDTRFEHVVGIDQTHLTASTPKHLLE